MTSQKSSVMANIALRVNKDCLKFKQYKMSVVEVTELEPVPAGVSRHSPDVSYVIPPFAFVYPIFSVQGPGDYADANFAEDRYLISEPGIYLVSLFLSLRDYQTTDSVQVQIYSAIDPTRIYQTITLPPHSLNWYQVSVSTTKTLISSDVVAVRFVGGNDTSSVMILSESYFGVVYLGPQLTLVVPQTDLVFPEEVETQDVLPEPLGENDGLVSPQTDLVFPEPRGEENVPK